MLPFFLIEGDASDNYVSPYGPLMVRSISALEQLQDQAVDSAKRDRIQRAKSRSRRRFIAAQPKRLVVIDALREVPGQPASGALPPFANDFPREWVCRWDTDRQARFGAGNTVSR